MDNNIPSTTSSVQSVTTVTFLSSFIFSFVQVGRFCVQFDCLEVSTRSKLAVMSLSNEVVRGRRIQSGRQLGFKLFTKTLFFPLQTQTDSYLWTSQRERVVTRCIVVTVSILHNVVLTCDPLSLSLPVSFSKLPGWALSLLPSFDCLKRNVWQ